MLIKKQDDGVIVRSLDGSFERKIVLPGDLRFNDFALSPDNRSVAFAVPGSEGAKLNDRSLLIVDLESGHTSDLRRRPFFEPQWFPSSRRIAYSSGKSIWSVDVSGSDHVEHIRYSRTFCGPQTIQLSPDERYVCGHKWKRDNKYLIVNELAAPSSDQPLSVTCHKFTWFDERQLAYDSLSRGIRLCDAATGKTSSFLSNVASLAPISTDPNLLDIVDVARSAEHCDLDHPCVLDGRMYIRLHTYTNTEHYNAVISVNLPKNDARCEYLVRSELARPFTIGNFVVLDGGKVVAAEVVRYGENTLRLGAEWRYSGDCVVPLGFFPLPNSQTMRRGSYVPW